jgi:hypothetical protein
MSYENQVGSGSLHGAKMNSPTTKDTVHGALVDIDNEIQRVYKLLSALDGIADRVHGPRPQEVGSERNPEPPPSSILDNLGRKRASLREVISRCESAIVRISDTIG